MIVRSVENHSRVEMISTTTESQRNLGGHTYIQTDSPYTVTAGPPDRRSENIVTTMYLVSVKCIQKHNLHQIKLQYKQNLAKI